MKVVIRWNYSIPISDEPCLVIAFRFCVWATGDRRKKVSQPVLPKPGYSTAIDLQYSVVNGLFLFGGIPLRDKNFALIRVSVVYNSFTRLLEWISVHSVRFLVPLPWFGGMGKLPTEVSSEFPIDNGLIDRQRITPEKRKSEDFSTS